MLQQLFHKYVNELKTIKKKEAQKIELSNLLTMLPLHRGSLHTTHIHQATLVCMRVCALAVLDMLT